MVVFRPHVGPAVSSHVLHLKLNSYRTAAAAAVAAAEESHHWLPFSRSRIGSYRLSGASYLHHIGHHVKVWYHPWVFAAKCRTQLHAAAPYEVTLKLSISGTACSSGFSWIRPPPCADRVIVVGRPLRSSGRITQCITINGESKCFACCWGCLCVVAMGVCVVRNERKSVEGREPQHQQNVLSNWSEFLSSRLILCAGKILFSEVAFWLWTGRCYLILVMLLALPRPCLCCCHLNVELHTRRAWLKGFSHWVNARSFFFCIDVNKITIGFNREFSQIGDIDIGVDMDV